MSSGEQPKPKGGATKIVLVQDSPFDAGQYLRDWRQWLARQEGPPPSLRVAVVTAANGFVGSHLVRALLRRGVTVRALVRPQADCRSLSGLDVDVRRGSLDDPTFVREVLRGADALFHLAATCPSHTPDVGTLYRVNVGLVRYLLKEAWDAGVSRIVHVSTIDAVGRRADGTPPDGSEPFREWHVADDYVRSRHLGELAALTWAQMGAPVVVVTPTVPVGAGDWRPSRGGRLILAVLKGERPAFPPGGMNFVPVEDVAEGIILAALRGRPGQRYILGHIRGNLTLAQFVAMVARAGGVKGAFPEEPRRRHRWPFPWRRQSAHREPALTANPWRAVEELGMPQSDLEAAFAKAVAWFRATGMA